MHHPWIVYLTAYLGDRVHRARTAPTRGASAVEWVIITAIIAGVALGLATVIRNLVVEQQGTLEENFGGGGGNPADVGGGGNP